MLYEYSPANKIICVAALILNNIRELQSVLLYVYVVRF